MLSVNADFVPYVGTILLSDIIKNVAKLEESQFDPSYVRGQLHWLVIPTLNIGVK